ncbi:CCE_0567 family metalloprotein [Extensimonas perlucida]|uniref:CCE_0567 family metalloprotein n=1 Tax=Extensimonas perlucida TaxID=2590786 RepID=UPI0011A51DF4|nr:CCE_0567 family metalloprotein [Extensimonas perlucida]
MSTDTEDRKAQLKKLNARATQAKMDLHDLSEELPQNWENILTVAQRCYAAHAELMQARQEQAAAGG